MSTAEKSQHKIRQRHNDRQFKAVCGKVGYLIWYCLKTKLTT